MYRHVFQLCIWQIVRTDRVTFWSEKSKRLSILKQTFILKAEWLSYSIPFSSDTRSTTLFPRQTHPFEIYCEEEPRLGTIKSQ